VKTVEKIARKVENPDEESTIKSPIWGVRTKVPTKKDPKPKKLISDKTIRRLPEGKLEIFMTAGTSSKKATTTS